MIRGSCLCGGVRFAVDGRISAIGMCHCSQCRKVSGTASNAVILTAAANVEWIEGEDLVTTWNKPSGWGATFCRVCGSPVPRTHPQGKICWVPVGVLDQDPGVKVERHIFVGSKACWDEIAGDAEQFDERPPA